MLSVPLLVAAWFLSSLFTGSGEAGEDAFGCGAETIDGLIANTEDDDGVEVLDELEWDRSKPHRWLRKRPSFVL